MVRDVSLLMFCSGFPRQICISGDASTGGYDLEALFKVA